ncbi:hypothetical protein LINGRAHAP2_LOCUS27898 [Linum grandiflorum]
MALVSSNARFVLTFYRVLLVGSRLWFQISSPSGFTSDTKIFQPSASFVECLVMVISTVVMRLSYLSTRRSVEIKCWLVPKVTKSKLQILRRWPLLNRKGSLKSLFLPFSILTSKYHRVLVQVQCKFRIHPLPIRLCCLLRNIPFVMVILALLVRVFLFDVPFPLTYLIFPSPTR